jgi:hypothetical protein
MSGVGSVKELLKGLPRSSVSRLLDRWTRMEAEHGRFAEEAGRRERELRALGSPEAEGRAIHAEYQRGLSESYGRMASEAREVLDGLQR